MSNQTPANHELLTFIEACMRTRKAGGTPAYAPPDTSREEKALHLLRMARTRFPKQPCPLSYIVWVVDGPVKRPNDGSPAIVSLKALLKNKRVKEATAKKKMRIMYINGVGKDAGYRLNADDDDMATVVLATDKRRARNALVRAAQTHTMIDESKLTLAEAREEYNEVGGMVSALSQAGYLQLEDLPQEVAKRLQSSIAKRKKRSA